MTKVPVLLLLALSASPQDAARPTPAPTPAAGAEKPERPDDKTLVASFEVVQGEGRDRLSVYRDGTLALARTYAGVRTIRKGVLSEEEVDFVRRVASEALALDVSEYRVDVLGRGERRWFRIEVGRPDALPRDFAFDELARIPLALGRARSALEDLLGRFEENAASSDELWDASSLRLGDVLTNRFDGKRYRIVRDDAFVRSLEMIDEERGLQRLVVLREDVPRLFRPPAGVGERPR